MKPTLPSTLIAMSSFKGTLSNIEACETVAKALDIKGFPSKIFPVGDGGSGTVDAIARFFHGDIGSIQASDPMGHKVQARVLCLPDLNSPDTIYIESSETCGYHLVKPEHRDAMRASSFGLGEIIKEVLRRWEKTVSNVYVGLGDSAISDMGMGMLSALGFRFFDAGGHVLWGNAHGLRLIRTVQVPDLSHILKIKFTALCDVVNPLIGPNGSAQTFSKQKGASSSQIQLIEQGMGNFANLIQEMNGRILRDEPMSGASGGLAAAFSAFFGAELVLGATFLLDWLNFERELSNHQLLITGEGTTDHQTLNGKVPMVCLETARRMGVQGVLISGALGSGFESIIERKLAAAAFNCGDRPTAATALHDKVLEIFSNPTFLKAIGFPSQSK